MSRRPTPSPWQINHARAVWERVRAALVAADPSLEDDEVALGELMRAETADIDAITAELVRASIEAEMEADALARRIGELQNRQARANARRQRCRDYALSLLEAQGFPALREPDFSASRGRSAPGVHITDADLVPDKYCRIERIPKKSEIGDALDAGEIVPGAERTNGTTYLRVVQK